jgi:hypothetical protein
MNAPSPIKVFPAKHFFVEMLTRDISLADAILDLLDNCVDGVRRKTHHHGDKPYEGYYAEISFDEKNFSIIDNCGGISKADAESYAFMFGRPNTAPSPDDSTIGMVGIGMKRAMFKIGTNCLVHSHHQKDTFEVAISPAWLKNDGDWNLKLQPVKSDMKKHGTRITVTNIRKNVSDDFAEGSNFRDDELPKRVKESFGLLIERGFKVAINGVVVKAAVPHLLWQNNVKGKADAIRPYVYRDTVDGVDVFLAFGIRESDKESAVERATQKYQSDLAGWTVACNDRIVLYCDRSELTGWGSMGAAQYHTQFIYLSGIVEFHSSKTSNLPFTTTKRGINQGSTVYLKVRDRMIEALKQFTSWTNEWKDRPSADRDQLFKQAKSLPLPQIRTAVTKEYSHTSASRGQPIKPKLPKAKVSTEVNIQFRRTQEDIDTVSDYLFDETRPARVVGEACFDRVLKEAEG